MAGSADIVMPTVVHDEEVAVCSATSVSSRDSFVTNAKSVAYSCIKRKGGCFLNYPPNYSFSESPRFSL